MSKQALEGQEREREGGWERRGRESRNQPHLYSTISMASKDEASRPHSYPVGCLTFMNTVGTDVATVH